MGIRHMLAIMAGLFAIMFGNVMLFPNMHDSHLFYPVVVTGLVIIAATAVVATTVALAYPPTTSDTGWQPSSWTVVAGMLVASATFEAVMIGMAWLAIDVAGRAEWRYIIEVSVITFTVMIVTCVTIGIRSVRRARRSRR